MLNRVFGWAVIAVLAVVTVFLWMTDANATESEMQMLSKSVRVADSGTGVVIRSEMVNGYPVTEIITAFHVVAGYAEEKELPPGRKDKDGKKWVYKPMKIEWFRYEHSRHVETIVRDAYIVKHDKDKDLALLRVVHRSAPMQDGLLQVAQISGSHALNLFDDVVAVGAGLGQNPMPTFGKVSSLDAPSPSKDHTLKYVLHSAQIIYGYSGGGLWRQNISGVYELAGVNVMINVATKGFTGVPVNFMACAVSTSDIKSFLK